MTKEEIFSKAIFSEEYLASILKLTNSRVIASDADTVEIPSPLHINVKEHDHETERLVFTVFYCKTKWNLGRESVISMETIDITNDVINIFDLKWIQTDHPFIDKPIGGIWTNYHHRLEVLIKLAITVGEEIMNTLWKDNKENEDFMDTWNHDYTPECNMVNEIKWI